MNDAMKKESTIKSMKDNTNHRNIKSSVNDAANSENKSNINSLENNNIDCLAHRTITSGTTTMGEESSSNNATKAVDLIFHPSVLLADVLSYAGPDGISKLRNFPIIRKQMSLLSTQELIRVGLPCDLNVPLSKYIIRVLRTFLVENAISSRTTPAPASTLSPFLLQKEKKDKEQLSYIGKLALARSSLASDLSLHKLSSYSISKPLLASPEDDHRHLRIVEAVAKNASASSQVLQYIAKHEMKRQQQQHYQPPMTTTKPSVPSSFPILEAVANHKNTYSSTLHLLSLHHTNTNNHLHRNIQALVTRNSNTSTETLSTILNSIYQQQQNQHHESLSSLTTYVHVLSGIATNPNTSIQNLETLSQHPDAYIRSAIAQNPKTPTSTLVNLAQRDMNFQVRCEVAGNINLPSDTLDEISYDVNYAIRIHVARNVGTSVETLKRLVLKDHVLDVCLAALNNPVLHVDDLIEKEGDYFLLEGCGISSLKRRRLIASKSTNPNVLEKLFNLIADDEEGGEEEHRTKLAIAQNVHTPSTTLTSLSTSSEEQIRAAVARNESTPIPLLQTLSKDTQPHVRTCVAKNRCTPSFILDALCTDADVGVRDCVVQNLNTSGSSLSTIAKNAISHHRNRHTTTGAADFDNNCCFLLVAIAEHSNTTPEVLAMLSRNEWAVVREAVARNPKLPAFHLKELSLEKNQPSVIRGLTRNSLVQRVAEFLSHELML